ncbi:hypothetical protein CIB48_g5552 [Xylaria polymorpha]|nr:hypothetical protein CIB48_g5552 [Xylaria polymorpha]
MATTENQSSDSNAPIGAIGNGESNTGASAKGSATAEKEAPVQSSEAVLRELQQKITSLEQDLDTEKKSRMKAQNDFKTVVKQWKQVAQELSQQQTDAKSFYTVTDSYLKQLAEEIRYDVRCFSQAYFEDLPPQRWPQQPLREEGRSPACTWPEGYEECPASPALAQSFIWRVLEKKVFGHYKWTADKSIGSHLSRVSTFLRPNSSLNETEEPSQIDALRRFHVWRATTVNMVFNEDTLVHPRDKWKKFEESLIAEYIDPVVSPFILPSESGRYYDLLIQIIEKALIMDREISRQAAWVRWVFDDLDGHTETAPSTDQEGARVILAPAMIKRGKSSGEAFEEQVELLPADICVVRNLLSLKARRREGEDSLLNHDLDHLHYTKTQYY